MKKKTHAAAILVLVFLFNQGMFINTTAQAQSNSPRPDGPCDIYATAGCPCVAAHSTTRALFKSYTGPLYQVMRQSDGKTLDIGMVSSGGFANAVSQDAFLSGTIGWMTKIYDQSGKGNDLEQAPPGTFKGPAPGGFDNLPIADMAPVTINGHKAYGVYIMPGMGLRCNNAKDVANNDEPEGIYYVINGKHYSSGCCFDYGNSSTNSRAVGRGTMETTYYGTASAWGSGNGEGPWIMADMEAGLFSGYNAKKNDVPTIDSWKFVSAFVDGGGGNKWDLRGGNAQEGKLTTFYNGVRPGSKVDDNYYPMHKKGAILLGNGGDNGNGSAGTFYEGVMTVGFPSEATTDAVQANIVAAKYNVPGMRLSRSTTFTPRSSQDITLSFTNTTGTPLTGVRLSLSARNGWIVVVSGTPNASKTFTGTIAPDASVSVTFKVTSPTTADAGFMTAKAEWTSRVSNEAKSETTTQRIRNVLPVKINEIRFNTGANPTNQFIELYNSSGSIADISNWNLISTQSEWAPLKLATIPQGTKLPPKSFYVLGLSTTGLAAPASPGDKVINVRRISGMEAGQQINIEGEVRIISKTGTAASPMTTLFVPVSTGPWLYFPAGSTNLPVTTAEGFTVGQKIGIALGGNYEVATVTEVGKAATQTSLAAEAKAGDHIIKVLDNASMTIGDILTISTGSRMELARVKRIINVVTAPVRGRPPGEPGQVELEAPLKFDHMVDVDVSDRGTGISFIPATRFEHNSGEAAQALGSGITLDKELTKGHEVGAPVVNAKNTSDGYQGKRKPDQWYGYPLSTSAGSTALVEAEAKALVDAMVYGSRQSNSSANGTITSPEIATLEGDQSQGGCIVVVPNSGRNFFQPAISNDQSDKSFGRFPDGHDDDSNCSDFHLQNTTTLAASSTAGTKNIKVTAVTDFRTGQKVIIGSGNRTEAAEITSIGTPGATTLSAASPVGVSAISVSGANAFHAGQTITIGSGVSLETAIVASVTIPRRRFGSANNVTDSIILSKPLQYMHAPGDQVSGSGITFATALKFAHENGEQIAANIPTPGKPNRYLTKTD